MNYKIRVNSEAESKDVQGLFFEMGYKWIGIGAVYYKISPSLNYITAYCEGKTLAQGHGLDAKKEITIPQLKDMVVLKRNDPKDSNVSEENCLYDLYLTDSGDLYFYHCDKNEWILSNLNGDEDYYKSLKPIEKPMKEFLVKSQDGKWRLETEVVGDPGDDIIEVPEGADIAVYPHFSKGISFFKNNFRFAYADSSGEWKETDYCPENLKHWKSWRIAWQRETLNDKVASAEVARQEFIGAPFSDLPAFNFEAVDDFVESNVEQGVKHSHYKKDISHLNALDIYRVTELFNPHSCGAHIAKKALCSGQRGHKDLLTDIQDIIDTAERWKEMLIEDEKAK